MIRLIASDIDGTLIKDSTPDLYPEMVQAIEALMKQGILFCAASGRQYQSMRNVFRDVESHIIFIAENGAQIRYKGEDISVIPMKREIAEEIITELRKYGNKCDIIADTAEGSMTESDNKEFIDLLTYGYHNEFTLVKDILETEAEIIKISVYQKESVREFGETVLIPEWKDKVKVTLAGEEWVDFMDESVDKGHALTFIQKYFDIKKEETIAFGDNNNDIGMLRAAGTGYAVENARDEVKQAADRICPSYLEKGVYQVVKDLINP